MAQGDYRVYPVAATGAAPVSSATAFTQGTAVAVIPSITLAPQIAIYALDVMVETAATLTTTHEAVFQIYVNGEVRAQVPWNYRNVTAVDYFFPPEPPVFLPEPLVISPGAKVDVSVATSQTTARTYRVKALYIEGATPTVPGAFSPSVVDTFTGADGTAISATDWGQPTYTPWAATGQIKGNMLGYDTAGTVAAAYWKRDGALDSFDYGIEIGVPFTAGQMMIDLVTLGTIGSAAPRGYAFTFYDGLDGSGRCDVYRHDVGSDTYITTVVSSTFTAGAGIGVRYTGSGTNGVGLYTKPAAGAWTGVWSVGTNIQFSGPAYAGPRFDFGIDANARFDNSRFLNHYAAPVIAPKPPPLLAPSRAAIQAALR